MSHLVLNKTGDPTFNFLSVLLAVMALVWPVQLLRILALGDGCERTTLIRLPDNYYFGVLLDAAATVAGEGVASSVLSLS